MNNQTKHTPGPWIFYADLPSVEPNWHVVTTGNRLRVLANVHLEPGNETDAANARLIAAAPDLLEALKSFMGCRAGDGSKCAPTDADFEKARAAIAKAEGSA